VAVGRMNGVATVTEVSYKIICKRFAATNISGRNNEVIVRRGSTV